MTKPRNITHGNSATSMNDHSKKTVANPSPGSSDPGNESAEKRKKNNPSTERNVRR